ncbi:unnamed protein product [uncultured virus]|nr:unnamed protein product [uncultured virus]
METSANRRRNAWMARMARMARTEKMVVMARRVPVASVVLAALTV